MSSKSRTSSDQDDKYKVIVEEDWSSIMTGGRGIGGGEESNKDEFLTGFAQHHHHVTIDLSSTSLTTKKPSITINCVESLTPLDMINLSNGNDDSTGHRIWMGALFFIKCFAYVLPSYDCDCDCNDNDNNSYRKNNSSMINMMKKWRRKLFHQKNIIELGAGTGISGISILRMAEETSGSVCSGCSCSYSCSSDHYDNENIIQPKSVTFTDSDPAVLELCKKNIKQNITSKGDENDKIYHPVYQLTWGIEDNTQTIISKHSMDCVIATDVIYDISAIEPLFQTASLLLKRNNGYFILSHIPRASVEYCSCQNDDNDDNNYVDDRFRIESLIIKEAKRFGFHNVHWNNNNERSIDNETNDDDGVHYNYNSSSNFGDDHCCIRPKDLFKIQNNSKMDYDEMESIGAGMFIFEYMGCYDE